MFRTLLLTSLVFFASCASIKKVSDRLHGNGHEAQVTNQKSQVKSHEAQVSAVETKSTAIVAQKNQNASPKPNIENRTSNIENKSSINPPIKVMREFRAAWVATVANIDWPSKPGLSAYEQQQEAIELLDFLKDNQFNAVVFQVRPQADALYKSDIEPWSYFLSGKQGDAPEPFYDPLAFWIDEAHKRGLELHAWLNPYRAFHTNGNTISDKSIVKTNPELVYRLQEGYYWMDPSLKATQDQTSRVVNDIVKRYDVDGIHFDDYFYPYPSYNGGKDFPDDKSYSAYQQNGGSLSRGDWRRDAVNTLIERIYKEIKAEKKYVKFGLSPFGIWRPGFPSSVTGFDQYDKLYADAKLWLNKGWIDYFAPQLYWPINKTGQRFPDLLSWWQSENILQRHLWPGISVVNNKPSVSNSQEILDEIGLTRSLVSKSMGAIHWNISSLVKNPELAEKLMDGPYTEAALIPASPWLDNIMPSAPVVSIQKKDNDLQVNWKSKETDLSQWIVYSQYGNQWEYAIYSKTENTTSLPLQVKNNNGLSNVLKNIIVTAIDRAGNESESYLVPIH